MKAISYKRFGSEFGNVRHERLPTDLGSPHLIDTSSRTDQTSHTTEVSIRSGCKYDEITAEWPSENFNSLTETGLVSSEPGTCSRS